MIKKYTAALVQMDTGGSKEKNLEKIERMTAEAAAKKAELICFPEMVNLQSAELSHLQRAESLQGDTMSFFSGLAEKYGIYICCGTILELIPDSDKVYNTSVLFGRDGRIKAVYRKRHTFDISLKDGREFRESDTVMPGNDVVAVDTEIGKIGFGICYDIRFPEQFREMSLNGMEILLLPASFTKETGQAHWDTLVRARAIENGCYVFACDQCGKKTEYEAYGGSMIVDPWGRILAKADTQETLLLADIDLNYPEEVRMQIPAAITR